MKMERAQLRAVQDLDEVVTHQSSRLQAQGGSVFA
jgi:hypothetical protein